MRRCPNCGSTDLKDHVVMKGKIKDLAESYGMTVEEFRKLNEVTTCQKCSLTRRREAFR